MIFPVPWTSQVGGPVPVADIGDIGEAAMLCCYACGYTCIPPFNPRISGGKCPALLGMMLWRVFTYTSKISSIRVNCISPSSNNFPIYLQRTYMIGIYLDVSNSQWTGPRIGMYCVCTDKQIVFVPTWIRYIIVLLVLPSCIRYYHCDKCNLESINCTYVKWTGYLMKMLVLLNPITNPL